MNKRQRGPLSAEREDPGELTLNDHIPPPGAVLGGVWDILPQLPSVPFHIVGELSKLLPDFEAGQ